MCRYLKLSTSVDDNKAANIFIESLQKLIEDLGLPTKLKDLPMPEPDDQQLKALSALAMSDPAMVFNSRQASEQDIIELYKSAY